VLLKPSPLAPLTPAYLCRLLLEAGVPTDLLALVNSQDSSVGQWLLEDQRIDFYTFTGSTQVGRIIAAGAGLRGTQLELGSIASTIVCADADLDRAAPKIANAAFRKAGQVCTSTQRIYAHQQIVEDLQERIATAAAALTVGDPRDPATRIGPMISPESVSRIQQSIDAAVSSGARVLVGGKATRTTLEPTVLVDVPVDAAVSCQEAFAPVVVIEPFTDLGDAIAQANNTSFGLSCGFFSTNTADITRAMNELRFGAVHINEASSARADEMPFGGVKDSGHGWEGPRYAVREYTEERLITWNT
jgi:succinate-semialdehyde dehydrogenase/glutarate-semialdehyde dehydrogenase